MQSDVNSLKVVERVSSIYRFSFIGIAFLVFSVDRFIKYYVIAKQYDYTINKGLAFSLFDDKPYLSILLSLLGLFIFILFVRYIWKDYLRTLQYIHIMIFTIIGASLSNIVDRFLYGGVIDYLYLYRLPSANIADYLIILSIITIIITINYKYEQVRQ